MRNAPVSAWSRIRETVHTNYGTGLVSYLKFFYYAFLEINNFIVLKFDSRNAVTLPDIEPEFTIHVDDFEELERQRQHHDLSKEFYCDQRHKVSSFYLVTYDNEVAYIHWNYFKGDTSSFLVLNERQSEFNYVVTMPQFRGKNLCSKMVNYAVKDLGKKGFEEFFVVIHDQNVASIKAFKKAGFSEIGTIKRFLRMNRKLHLPSPPGN